MLPFDGFRGFNGPGDFGFDGGFAGGFDDGFAGGFDGGFIGGFDGDFDGDFDGGGFNRFIDPFFTRDPCVCVMNGFCDCECLCGFKFFERKGRLFRSRIL
jgi:hypothetical protein